MHSPCYIIPTHLLQKVASNPEASSHSRACAARSLLHSHRLQAGRKQVPDRRTATIVPTAIYDNIINNEAVPDEAKNHARQSKAHTELLSGTRKGGVIQVSPDFKLPKGLNRVLYDCEHTDSTPGLRIRQERQKEVHLDECGHDTFRETYDFWYEMFGRSSIDGLGMKMEGSIHFDDEVPPPGFANAYWNGERMVFGDGDFNIFQDFTAAKDVIAHELTHGMVQHTADLAYNMQAGALNEHFADVFGSMVKQWRGGVDPQRAVDADWLIGEGIFNPATNIVAIRSMKEPGTAYDSPLIGQDPQVGHMGDFRDLPDDDANDFGGVHINSGIPNKAFYLAATGLGEYSWDVAGRIWYETLVDPELRIFAADAGNWRHNCFPFFACLTVQHAARYANRCGNADVAGVVAQAWQAVGIDHVRPAGPVEKAKDKLKGKPGCIIL